MQKWEYKLNFKPDEFELNMLGEQGWELVAVIPAKFVADAAGDKRSSLKMGEADGIVFAKLFAFLKRPKEEK